MAGDSVPRPFPRWVAPVGILLFVAGIALFFIEQWEWSLLLAPMGTLLIALKIRDKVRQS